MKEIKAFKTTDGQVFEDESKATKHQKQFNCEKACKEIINHFVETCSNPIEINEENISYLASSMAKNPDWVIALLEQAMEKNNLKEILALAGISFFVCYISQTNTNKQRYE